MKIGVAEKKEVAHTGPDLRWCGICWGKDGVRHYCDEPLGHGKDGSPHKCHCGATTPLIKKLTQPVAAK